MKIPHPDILAIVAAGVSTMLLAGCADDSFPSPADSRGGKISFKVSAGFSPSSRGGGRTGYAPAVAMTGDSGRWLVPETREGFPTADCHDANTRSSMTDGSTIADFAAFARRSDSAKADADYMFNVRVARDNSWTPDGDFLWPTDGSLHFTAYSPYRAVADVSEGIISLPEAGKAPAVEFKVPAEVIDQFDFMTAIPVDASASPCPIVFNHALTAVRFAAGAELAPCRVTGIEISGVADSGMIDLENGEWSGTAGKATYTLHPDTQLTAADGSQYVAADTPLTSDDMTMLLMPQTLPENASVVMTVETGGRESRLEASLAGLVWKAGTTVTYRLSGNPDSDNLILDVEGTFDSPYTGASIPFTVRSSVNQGGESSDVEWKAEFVDPEGNVIDTPAWIAGITAHGTGTSKGNVVTQMNDIIFHKMTTQTHTLQEAVDINTQSGFIPYNLASATGAATIENTANTYVVNAPGRYSLPLVYGNAIKNGTANTGAYISTSHARNVLKTFENHLGNGISSPYIYDNPGCTPADAVLVWEDELNLVRNVALSADGHSITFDIPANTIRQGNAMIAVRDADGTVMWSWQLWITDYRPADMMRKVSVSGTSYTVWTENLGYVAGGDEVEFPEASVLVRFMQVNVPEGMEPLVKTVTLTQAGAVTTTPECNTFYQWGRKDPMMSSVKQWYNADHQEIEVLPLQDYNSLSDLVSWCIRFPATMVQALHDTSSSSTAPTVPYTNLWNVSMATTSNVKSVYDPCPAGSKISYGRLWQGLNNDACTTLPNGDVAVNPGDGGTPLVFPLLGYRASSTGNLDGVGSRSDAWSAHINSQRTEAASLVIESGRCQSTTSAVFHAFSVRPEAE